MNLNLSKNSKCQYFKSCGGCDYLDLEESEYQKIKKENLFSDLQKLGELKINFFPNENSEFFKRRKVIFQINEFNKICFFKKNSKELIEVEKCYVCEDEISQIIIKIQDFLTKISKDLIEKIQITLFDNILDLIFFTKKELNLKENNKFLEFAKDNKINISYNFNKKINPIFISENSKILLKNYCNLEIQLNLNSDIFIQASKKGLQKIIEIIRDFVLKNFTKKIKIADIYSGFGIYSFALSDFALEIQAFEGIQEMTDLIELNAKINSLKNKIIAKNRDLFTFAISRQELNNFDLVIINPPRNGALPQIQEIAKSKLQNLIYVSCNPKTFCKDALILKENGFEILQISAIDQFYMTNHFEIVAVFTRKI